MSDPNAPQEGLAAAPQPSTSAPEPPIGAPGDPGTPPPAPKKSGKLGRIIGGVVVVLVLVVGGIGYNLLSNRNTAANAKEGDCLSGAAVTSDTSTTVTLKLAKCDAADARYKVVGLVADKVEADAKNELCEPFAEKGAEVLYWQEKSRGSGRGNVLCLAPAK